MYGLVNPGLDPIIQRYWAGKRFAVYPSTFEAFLHDLDANIPESARALSYLLISTQSSIDVLNKTHTPPSSNLLRYLQDELEHVHKGMATTGASPTDFYKGIHSEWGVFQQDLDVRRRVADELIIEAFLDTRERAAAPELYLLKGHAGSGKSITLKRVAWDIANEYDGVVFFLKEGGVLRREHLLELHTLIGQRLYIVIEDAIPHISDIQNVFGWSEKTSTPITLILGARTNEWNVYAGSLESSAKEYELSDLTEHEIRQLIQRLEKCNGLGRLSNASPIERIEHFKLTSDRQLLVALHDLAGDKPFEEIILDEYLNIEPPEARILYLDVCTLHRLGVGIRAGLVSRISGITFDDFGRDFFRPLEHVVHTFFDYNTRDNMYRTRHREIAEMVFTQAMRDPSERAAQVVRIMRSMDVDYSSDEAAFRQMIRGRTLADDFSDKKLAMQIFEAALESGAPAFVVEHQRAVFELRHGDGDPTAALSSIEKAERSQQHVDKAIQNTKAAILRELATRSPQKLLRSRYREAAKKIIERDIVSSKVPHPFSTLGHIFIDELRDKLDELSDDQDQGVNDLQERSIADTIRSAEQTILQGLQRFPDDEFLLDLEAGLARILTDEKRALSALKKAFEANPGRGYIAVRYSTAIQRQGDTMGAKDILKRSLTANPSSKEAHFAYAQLLIHEDEIGQRDDINYHLRRSFTQGDSNLDAQFWTARHNFLYGDRDLAMTMFQRLEKTWIPAKYRNEVKGKVREKNGSVKWFTGSVKHVAEHYCYIASPDLRDDVFAYEGDFDENDWNKLSGGRRVSFALGFNFRGPRAMAVRVLN